MHYSLFAVIDDVVRTMFNPKFLTELFKPTEIYSPQSMRQVRAKSFSERSHSLLYSSLNMSTYDLIMMDTLVNHLSMWTLIETDYFYTLTE